MITFLILVFLTGGSARPDPLSLVILRPAAALFLGAGLCTMRWSQVRAWRWLFVFAAAACGLTILHLIPLPAGMWQALPGRQIVVEIDRTAVLGAPWRPLSMDPGMTRNALYALLVPGAALVLMVQLAPPLQYRLLRWILALGLCSALLGILQIAGHSNGPLYSYSVTNASSAVGLFANRNHAAMLLAALFPMLAVFASERHAGGSDRKRAYLWIAIAAAAALLPLVLVTGSRAGIVIGVIALGLATLLYPRSGGRRGADWLPAAAVGVLGIGLIALFVYSSQDRALLRLSETGPDEARLRLWPVIWQMQYLYQPFGSGIGSFVSVYQIGEPGWALSHNYLNHAHNDYLELALTGGIPAILLCLAAIAAGLYRGAKAWFRPDPDRQKAVFARLGAVVLLLLALGSVGDYPLRTPVMAVLFTIAAVWLHGAGRSSVGAQDVLGETTHLRPAGYRQRRRPPDQNT